MKTFREFLDEAVLGGERYAGKANPNNATSKKSSDDLKKKYDSHSWAGVVAGDKARRGRKLKAHWKHQADRHGSAASAAAKILKHRY